MDKLFICADIEGTAGILNWDETEKNKPDYAYFQKQMTLEVAAACEGAHEAGVKDILVRDAHDSARNILPDLLPPYARILRGWASDPACMMTGLDDSFHAAVLTGCHAAAGTDANPLSHTLDTKIALITINGEAASEAAINSLTAAMHGVPVIAVTGDKGVCADMQKHLPGLMTAPVSCGMGRASVSVHPKRAVETIRETVKKAVLSGGKGCLYAMPPYFEIMIRYKNHADAFRGSFYPGVNKRDAFTLTFESGQWFEVLRMLHFIA